MWVRFTAAHLCLDASSRVRLQVIKILETAAKARSAAFAPDGENLAVGVATGGLHVFVFHPAAAQVHWSAVATDAVSALAYSPDGALLAAGSHDQCASIL